MSFCLKAATPKILFLYFSYVVTSEKVDCSQELDVSSDEDEPANISSATENAAEDDREAEVTSQLLSTSSDATLNQGKNKIGFIFLH